MVGSDEDPTVILAAKSPGTCLGFQAYQGPGGHVAVVMQTTERGYHNCPVKVFLATISAR
jgi:hypothetical protein